MKKDKSENNFTQVNFIYVNPTNDKVLKIKYYSYWWQFIFTKNTKKIFTELSKSKPVDKYIFDDKFTISIEFLNGSIGTSDCVIAPGYDFVSEIKPIYDSENKETGNYSKTYFIYDITEPAFDKFFNLPDTGYKIQILTQFFTWEDIIIINYGLNRDYSKTYSQELSKDDVITIKNTPIHSFSYEYDYRKENNLFCAEINFFDESRFFIIYII
jgi:hypothetical protein